MSAKILKFILMFLPKKYKGHFEIMERMLSRLDTKEKITDAVNFLDDAIESDGYLSVPEWARFGSMIGMIGKSKSRKNKIRIIPEPIVAPTN